MAAPADAPDATGLSAPTDTTSVDIAAPSAAPPAPGRTFWSEVADLVGTGAAGTAATPGPIGAVVSDAARRDLESMLSSLRSREVHFYRERPVHMSSTDQFEEIDAAQAAATVLSQPAQFAAPLLVCVQAAGPGAMLGVRNLDGLQVLDALQGTGDPTALAHPQLGTTLKHAADGGAQFLATPPSGRTLEIPAFFAYQVLSGEVPLEDGVTWTAPGASQQVRNEGEALAHAYFEGQGSLDGVPHADLARQVTEIIADGISFLSDNKTPQEISPFDAWLWLSADRTPAPQLSLGVAGMPLARTTAANLPAARARLEPVRKVYREIVEPSGQDEATRTEIMKRVAKIGDPTSQEQTARMMVDAFRQEAHSPSIPYDWRPKTLALCDWMSQQLPRLDRPEEKTATLMRWIGACGAEEAQAAADFAWNELSQTHPDRAGYDQVVSQFDALLCALHRKAPAERAIQMLTLPVGAARPEERNAVFKRLLDAVGPLPERSASSWSKDPDPVEDILASYLVISAACGPEDRLEAVADAYFTLRDTLRTRGSVAKQEPKPKSSFDSKADEAKRLQAWEKETRGCFEFLENGRKAGLFPQKDREAAVLRFVEMLAITDSVEQARARMLSQGVIGTGAPASVQREEEFVVIGGVRVPVRKPAGPATPAS